MIQTIGMLEFNSIAKGIETCDVMLKAAEVSLSVLPQVAPANISSSSMAIPVQ